MRSLPLFLLCVCSAFLSFAQNKVRLDQHSTVTFPGKTEQMKSDLGLLTYSTLDRDNKVTGMATVIDASQYGLDSAAIAANYNNTLFIDLILQNVTGQYPGTRLVSKKKIARGKLMGYEVTLLNERPSEMVPYRNIYAQVYFAGTRIYALTVLAVDNSDISADRDQFFNSLQTD